MKILLLLGLVSISAYSQTLVETKGDIYKAMGVEREKMVSFLKGKNSPCYIAVGRTIDQTDKSKNYFFPEVLCILDGKMNEGTVNEKSGCAIGLYNVATGFIKGASTNDLGRPYMVMVDKDCSKGFYDLLKKAAIPIYTETSTKKQKSMIDPETGQKIILFDDTVEKTRALTVGEMLATGRATRINPPELLFTYSENYKDAFNELKKKFSK